VPAPPFGGAGRPVVPVVPAPPSGGAGRPGAPIVPAPPGGDDWRRARRESKFLISDGTEARGDRLVTTGGGLSLRPTLTAVSDGRGGGRALGLTAGGRLDAALTTARGVTARAHAAMFLGGGGAGLEGVLGGTFDVGWRAPVAETHGPVVRAGLLGLLAGNDLIYDSRLELPRAQIGYQVFADEVFVEAGLQPGAVLAGRFAPRDGGARELGGTFDAGAYVTWWSRWLRLDLEARRFVGRGGEGRRGSGELVGALCTRAGPVYACLDGRHERGEVPGGDGTYATARATYAGALVGLEPAAFFAR
jgi:hypothetical protein